jgi:large subunit ribosomal protein L13
MKNILNSNNKKWYVIDAKGKTLGRLSSIIATIISGKHKSIFNPSTNCGDYVIVINSQEIKVTGKKIKSKNLSSPFRTPWRIKD